jgi:CheY-like chemotaxis protein
MAETAKSRVRSTQLNSKILVVDDNPDEAELVSALLELLGNEVRTAHTPADALKLATQFQPEIAFLDIGLPTMDGFELAAALRALPGLRDCRFVAITGYNDASDRRQSKCLGFEAHLLKPIAMETLEHVLTRELESRAARGLISRA